MRCQGGGWVLIHISIQVIKGVQSTNTYFVRDPPVHKMTLFFKRLQTSTYDKGTATTW